MPTADELLDAHVRSATRFDVDGLSSAVWTAGTGEPVVCIHGVPVSAWLYRNLLPELSRLGLCGVAFDLPGMGLADRPADHDYSWSSLGAFAAGAIDALELGDVHLVVHDIGGPVGFEVAHRLGDRVRSLTVLDTLVEVASFRKPWVMRPFEVPWLGELWLGSMIEPAFVQLMYLQGISDASVVPAEEIRVHLRLLRRDDGGKAFLKVMRSFETTPEAEARYLGVFDHPRPTQAIWGTRDPALRVGTYGAVVRHLVGDEAFHEVDGKHFLQETHAPFIAQRVASLAKTLARS